MGEAEINYHYYFIKHLYLLLAYELNRNFIMYPEVFIVKF